MTKLKWRPIASAPKETPILIWSGSTNYFFVGRVPSGHPGMLFDGDYLFSGAPFFYWMPIPEPPKPKKKVTR